MCEISRCDRHILLNITFFKWQTIRFLIFYRKRSLLLFYQQHSLQINKGSVHLTKCKDQKLDKLKCRIYECWSKLLTFVNCWKYHECSRNTIELTKSEPCSGKWSAAKMYNKIIRSQFYADTSLKSNGTII